ncbi:hypothetical protein AACH06_17510 [Ideonella sp. DXS29W]|uniref:Lipoprotein n=1 Tax=Ideonella lacteola TaxID=2984193 RepID=A0ABU9BRM6_9BURK
MKKLVVSGLVVGMLAGCASYEKRPMTQESAKALRGQSVAVTARKAPDFTAMTPAKAAFGLLGAAAMISEGNGIIASNQVADPASTIAAQLTAAIGANYGTTSSSNAVATDKDDAPSIAASATSADRFVIDVQTINWSFVYFPSSWGRYRVIYTAKARLIDAQSKSVIAEGFCKRIPEDATNAPSYDELLNNQAARLKSELSLAAEECVKTLKAEMLAL